MWQNVRRWFLLVAILVFGVCAWAPLGQAVTITVNPGSEVTATTGGDTVVDIVISGLGAGTSPSLGIFDLTLVYDPAILSYTSVTWGSGLDLFGLGDVRSATDSMGQLNLFELSLDSSSDLNTLQKPSFVLGTVHFTGVSIGKSPLSLTINALGDASGLGLPANVVYGSAPEPANLLLLILGVAVLAKWRLPKNVAGGI